VEVVGESEKEGNGGRDGNGRAGIVMDGDGIGDAVAEELFFGAASVILGEECVGKE